MGLPSAGAARGGSGLALRLRLGEEEGERRGTGGEEVWWCEDEAGFWGVDSGEEEAPDSEEIASEEGTPW